LARTITFVLILQLKTHFFQKIFHKVARIGHPKKSLVKLLNIINTAHNSKNWTFRGETTNQCILSPQFTLNSIWIYRVSVFYFGKIASNFNLKSMILTYTQVFSWKNWPKFTRFQRKTMPNHQIFMISSSR